MLRERGLGLEVGGSYLPLSRGRGFSDLTRSPSQLCQEPCAEGLSFSPPETLGWTLWEPWSSCSRSCLTLGGGPGWRSRSRLCPNPEDNSCPGEATQEEPCSPPVCPGVPPLSLEWPEH